MLVNMKDMLAKAAREGYGVGNFDAIEEIISNIWMRERFALSLRLVSKIGCISEKFK